MRVYLKIKIKSLAAEAAIIRQEENRCRRSQAYAKAHDNEADKEQWGLTRFGLASHRRFEVRPESRHAGLAYGFLKGRSYAQMEVWCHEAPDFERIAKLAERFGEGDRREIAQRFQQWQDQAKEHLKTATKPVFERKPKPPYIAPQTAVA